MRHAAPYGTNMDRKEIDNTMSKNVHYLGLNLHLVPYENIGIVSTKDLLNRLTNCGVAFIKFIKGNPQLDMEAVERRIKPSGSIIVPSTFIHELLGKGVTSVHYKWPEGLASFSYATDNYVIHIGQVRASDGASSDELADGQLAFLRHIYPALRSAMPGLTNPVIMFRGTR